jgi:phosphoribosylformimino-5-aminoimidazole carboxamide ribotide isomerase
LSVLIIPAIDLKDGRCVRLQQGRMDSAKVFSDDPVAMARHWAGEGAKRLHIVDLNGAVAGRPRNEKVIRDMIAAVGGRLQIQLGGGIRDLDTIESYLDAGVTYIVVGTAAVKNPGFLSDACYAFPGHVIAGLDAKEGKVAVEGWSKMTGHDVVDLAKKFEEYGIEALVYTDIGRDGMLSGINIEATLRLAQATKTPIIASGGLNSVKDVQAVCEKLVPEGIIGAIAGRALYEGTLDLKKAQAAADKALGKE